MLGYDRHWSRYWLLEGSCPEAVTADESPASCWVYVERCHFPPGEKQQQRGSPDDEEEDLPLGQLAQQAQHGEEAPQRAKRRKVQIPDDQGDAVSWGCYKTVEHVSKLIDFLNTRGTFLYTQQWHVLPTADVTTPLPNLPQTPLCKGRFAFLGLCREGYCIVCYLLSKLQMSAMLQSMIRMQW